MKKRQNQTAFSLISPASYLKRKTSSFTLIELLVVISIIAILAGILMPALSSALQKGKIIQCTSNQKFIALALNMYASDNKEFYPSANYTDQPWNYWHRAILMGGYLGKTFKSKDQVYDITKRGKTVLPEDSNPASGGTGAAATDYRSYGLNDSIAETPPDSQSYVHYIPRTYLAPSRACGRESLCREGGIIQKGPQDIVLTADSRTGTIKWFTTEKVDHLNTTANNASVGQIYPFHRIGVPISFVDGHVRFIRYPFSYQKLNFENSLKL